MQIGRKQNNQYKDIPENVPEFFCEELRLRQEDFMKTVLSNSTHQQYWRHHLLC